MAITRIKNNQITDGTINAASKVSDFSITSAKLSNNFTYGSDFTITGNLTVQGTTTAVDTTNMTVEDPILLLASDQTGTPAVDIGFIGERGTETNIAWVWDESESAFVTGFTSDAESSSTLTISSYADIIVGSANVTANLDIGGTVQITGDLDVTGNIDGGNLNTAGLVDATGNVSGGNLVSAADVTTVTVTATGNIDGGNIISQADVTTVTVSATGNVDGGNITTAGAVDATGNVSGGNLVSAADVTTVTVTATGNVDGGNLTTGGAVAATGNVSGGNLVSAADVTTVTVTATGNIDGGNIISQADVTTVTVTATGNVDGGNLTTGGAVDATGNITGGNINTAGLVDATGNITGGNINTAGLVDATGNVSGGNLVSAADVTTVTVNASSTIDATGNITGGNINTAGLVDATGNITGGNINTAGLVDATGNVSGGNLVSAADVTTVTVNASSTIDATGNITGGNIVTAGKIDGASIEVSGNAVVGGDLTVSGNLAYVNVTTIAVEDPIIGLGRGANDAPLTSDDGKDRGSQLWYYDGAEKEAFIGWDNSEGKIVLAVDADITNEVANVQSYGNVLLGGIEGATASFTGNVDAGNLSTSGAFVVTGNVDGGNLNTTGQVVATGNVTGGNLITAGAVDAGSVESSTTITATGNVDGGNITTAGVVDATGNVSGGNITTAGAVDATGNITGGNLITAGAVEAASATISGLTDTRITFATTGGELTDNAGLTTTGTTLTATGNIDGGNIVSQADVTTVTVNASSTIDATGNITGGNLLTGGLIDATGNIDGGNLNTGGVVVATGNIDGGNLNTGGVVVATGNVTGGNIVTAGAVDATGNVTGGNLITAGDTDTATLQTSGEATLASATVSDLTDNRVVIAGTSGALEDDANFTFDGSTLTVGADASITGDLGSMTAVIIGDDIGNLTTDVALEIATTDSILIPVGSTGERPATPVTGMVRFNTTIDKLEFYDSDSWTIAGSDFTLIASQTFDGDGSTVAFTLSDEQTTASCIVSINGVVQLPTTAYAVSGTTLTFTEAPLSGDKVEVRKLTTTTTVTEISNASGTAIVSTDPSAGNVNITGNLIVSGDLDMSGNDILDAGTINGTATSAQYADLAENYAADAEYAPGTVVVFGGDAEVTAAVEADDHRVAGVVSTAPAYLMNSHMEAGHVAAVAFTGRVPCKVVGPVAKGDLMVSAGNGAAKANNNPAPGTIIGKALENFDGAEGTIEVVVGRF